ncbi:MAG: alpha/beta fold hydrolase [Thermoanaerobaculia bacterium]
MSPSQSFTHELDNGKSLHGIVDLPEQSGPRPTVVICHGFKGFLEWGFFPYLAQLLAERGLVAIRFNLTGSGMEPGEELVTRPLDFRNATFSQDLAELQSLLEAVSDHLLPDRIDPDRLGLFGHSRGGGTALLAASRDPWKSRLRALVTWAGVSTFDRLNEAEKQYWRERGEVPVVNARTGQELMIDVNVLRDLETHGPELDLVSAGGAREAPWLTVHGDEDETVPVDEARLLATEAAPPSELVVIEGGNHTFGAQHPFAGPTPDLVQALNATQRWFRKHLA